MGEKLVIGPINKGLRTDREPFYIDNDSFPTLINAYQWRGRIRRKRGTSLLGQLRRYLGTTNGSGNITVTIAPTPIISGISLFQIGTDYFYDPGGASPVTLITNGSGTAILDRSSGLLTITGSIASTSLFYYPSLPVMGLENLVLNATQFPATLGFDTTYAYNISTLSPYPIWDVSFYKNPQTGSYPSYVQKSDWTPTNWNGKNYQQFWSTNYQGAFWVTNGVDVPFTGAKIGMQFAGPSTTPTLTAATWVNSTTMIFTIVGNPLVVGDFVFANEFTGGSGLNLQTGYVIIAGDTFTVKFPYATIANAIYTPGILQYLTNVSDSSKDCLRWYDGDPTNGNNYPRTFVTGSGWVNFAPPLSLSLFSVADTNLAQYYLVGAKMIVNFKDRLLFLGPVIQTSSGSPIYLQDTVIYSQNGTAFYTSSFTGEANDSRTIFNPILVPTNQSATANAYFEDVTGFGGYVSAGTAQPITTVSSNEDSLIIGFSAFQTRFIYSGNDILPFDFYVINAELGSNSTFSTINMDNGVISRGNRGFIITSQTNSRRIDLDIPDQAFEISLQNNGAERFCSQRDFINEWIYFTYCTNQDNSSSYLFPDQTLQYNYRDDSWSIFNECYTTYGSFTPSSGLTWSTAGDEFGSWDNWDEPWNAGAYTVLQPLVIGGNQQGYVIFRDSGTNESVSLNIQNISGNTITCPNHCLNTNDYILISGCFGTIGTQLNGLFFNITVVDANTFTIGLTTTGSYKGGGVIQRTYIPEIQSKQFPLAWGNGRKTRIGVQQYLFTKTSNAQVTLVIFLSQNASSPYNDTPIVPAESDNNSLIYSTVLYTCPESTNLGLTPANINLQTPTASQQSQIWHRLNTSLIGDTFQFGITLSPTQMTTVDSNGKPISQFSEIEFHGCVIDVTASQLLV